VPFWFQAESRASSAASGGAPGCTAETRWRLNRADAMCDDIREGLIGLLAYRAGCGPIRTDASLPGNEHEFRVRGNLGRVAVQAAWRVNTVGVGEGDHDLSPREFRRCRRFLSGGHWIRRKEAGLREVPSVKPGTRGRDP